MQTSCNPLEVSMRGFRIHSGYPV